MKMGIVFIERWTSKDAIHTHSQTKHFQAMIQVIEPYIERPMELLTLTEIKG